MESIIKDIKLKECSNFDPPTKREVKKSSKFSNYLQEEKLSKSIFKFDYSSPKVIDRKIEPSTITEVAPTPPFFDQDANIVKNYSFDTIPLSYVYKMARNNESAPQRAMGLNFIAQIASKLYAGEYGSASQELKDEIPSLLLTARLALDSQNHNVISAALNALNCLLCNDLLVLSTTRLFSSIPGSSSIPFVHLQPHDDDIEFDSDEEIKRFEQDQILALLESGLFDRLNFLIKSHNLIQISQIIDFCLNFSPKAAITLKTTEIADQLTARLMEIDPCKPSPDLLPLTRCISTIQTLSPHPERSMLIQNFIESVFSAALQSRFFEDAKIAFSILHLASAIQCTSQIANDFLSSLIQSNFVFADENRSIFWTRCPDQDSANKAFVMILASAAIMMSDTSSISPFISDVYKQSIWSIEGVFFGSKARMSNLMFADYVESVQDSQFSDALANMISVPKVTRIHGDISVEQAIQSVLNLQRPTAFVPVTFFINSFLPRLACSLIVAQSSKNSPVSIKSWKSTVFGVNDCVSLSFQASLTAASKPATFTNFSSLASDAADIAPFRTAAMYLYSQGHSLESVQNLLIVPAIFPFSKPLISYIKGLYVDSLVAEAMLALNVELFDAWDLCLLIQDKIDSELLVKLNSRLKIDKIADDRLCSFLDHFAQAYLNDEIYETIQNVCLSSPPNVRAVYYRFLGLNSLYFKEPEVLESDLKALTKLSELMSIKRVSAKVKDYCVHSIKAKLLTASISEGPYISIILKNANAPESVYNSVKDEALRHYLTFNK